MLLKCSKFDKQCLNKKALSDHEKVHEDLVVQCHLCDNVFSKKGNLKQHVKQVHEKRNYSCKVCGITFVRIDKLKKHYKRCKERDKFP